MSFIYSSKSVDIGSQKQAASLVLNLGNKLHAEAKKLDQLCQGYFSERLKQKALTTSKLHSLSLKQGPELQHLHLVLLEDKGALAIRQQLKTLAKSLTAESHKELHIFADNELVEALGGALAFANALSQAFDYSHYRYDSTLSKKAASTQLKRIVINATDAKQIKVFRQGLKQGQAIASGQNLCRELGNLPGNYCTPAILGDKAKSLAGENSKLSVKVLGLKAIERLKMGSFLSVAKASSEEPRFIIFEYKGKSTGKPTVLVGKGITFDTGGISLKPGAGMDEMKYDMCGAASVFGCIKALSDMNAKVNVVGIIAAAENMPAGNASKPGDVVTSMSGQTIEVLNTDAEGRLVLCDALTYAERFKPKAVIDIATLTGACVIALGSHASGLYANQQELADKLLEAGIESGDRAWQMPLWEEYSKQLKSNFADLANIGGREAGSVTAACFLEKFAKAYPWAHLDIAGTAWNSGAQKGASGRPVELLLTYLLKHA
ncbi:leucyl aminopeptidase [Agaribacterium sp. ZY112]|uniref:leucyl aminopeptidase n=1 Tax=Agaribacterium sp. ZY112 TaxID=3233574 RepID=UPI003525B4E4